MSTISFYAVKKGIVEGIYESWEECRAQIDNFSGAQYKKFKTRDEAQQYMDTKEIVANIGTMHIANIGTMHIANIGTMHIANASANGSAIAIPNSLSPDQ